MTKKTVICLNRLISSENITDPRRSFAVISAKGNKLLHGF